jgi:hypothetical protein
VLGYLTDLVDYKIGSGLDPDESEGICVDGSLLRRDVLHERGVIGDLQKCLVALDDESASKGP